MKWLVFDCPSGIAGDMTLGALVDLGIPLQAIETGLKSLPLEGYRLWQSAETRHGIAATQVHVEIHTPRPGAHRHLPEVLALLRAGKLPQRALNWACDVFTKLARAEASVHRVPVEKVHFHEVGAIDAIVDIAGSCVGLHLLCEQHGIEAFRVSQIRVGSGVTRTEHGPLPVPPPAALQLLQGFPIQFNAVEGERVTPTGAALLATFAQPLGETAIQVERAGYGAGTMQFSDAPNVLRLLVCEPAPRGIPGVPAGEPGSKAGSKAALRASRAPGSKVDVASGSKVGVASGPKAGGAGAAATGQVGVVTTTIDDMVPEFFGHVMEKLFAAGALDVYYTPIYMKKGRPATQVTVIGEPEAMAHLANVLLQESSTLGVRLTYEERIELPRRLAMVRTPYGEIQVKVATRPDGTARVVPEYESVRRAAEAAGVALADVYAAALRMEAVPDGASDS